MINNPIAYSIVGTRDGRNITFHWFRDVFALDRASRFLELQGYKTRAWIHGNRTREQLW